MKLKKYRSNWLHFSLVPRMVTDIRLGLKSEDSYNLILKRLYIKSGELEEALRSENGCIILIL